MRARLGVALVCTCIVAIACAVPAHAAFPGSNGKIAFQYDAQVYTIDPDGTGRTQLTSNGSNYSPAWSPDGKRIAFATTYWGGYEIVVMNADGTGQQDLTNTPTADETGPTWSPDGKKILYSRGGALWTMNADGTDQAMVPNTSGFGGPHLAPDGSRIVATKQDPPYNIDIWTMNPDGTDQVKLTNPDEIPKSYYTDPDWSPDARKITFRTQDGDVWTMNPDGSAQVRILLTPGGMPAMHPAFSPDGTKITFRQLIDSDWQIMIMNRDGTNPTDITHSTGFPSQHDISPEWQPLPENYARPKSATPIRASLAVAYEPCTSPTMTHGAPLDFGSCAPQQASGFLTVGTPDANGKSANAVGSVRLDWTGELPIDPNNGNQSDLFINVNIADVRKSSDLSDYAGELSVQLARRITDKQNGYGALAGTVADGPLALTVPCAATDDPNVGSTCSTATSANALVPGSVIEGKRAIWQLGQVQVQDGGSSGVAGASDATRFLDEGVFVP